MKFRVFSLSQFVCLTLTTAIMLPELGYCEERPSELNIYNLVTQQQKMLEQQQQEIDELRKLVFDQHNQFSQQLDKAQLKVNKMAKSSRKVKVRISKKGLRIKSKEGDYSFQAGGRIHVDYAHFDDDVTSMGSGASLRRARLHFKGKLFQNWRYKAEIDFAEDGNVGPRAVWLDYNGWESISLKLGNFQEPFSLEEMSGSNAITFMERSLANTFAPSYHIGLGIKSSGSFWGVAGGLFGENLNNKSDRVDGGWGVAGRATIAPVLFESKILHLGFSSEYRQTDTENEIRVRARPESRGTNRRLIDTRTITDVDHTWLFGAEIATVYGPFSLQAEYIHQQVVRKQANNLGFNGAYLQGSWFLTGESRSYSIKQGVFGLINPLHNYGAWEVALRYSGLNLNDQEIQGGKENNFTLGLNWYANYNVRFMLNYTLVNAHPNRDGIDENPNIIQMRGQIVFRAKNFSRLKSSLIFMILPFLALLNYEWVTNFKLKGT